MALDIQWFEYLVEIKKIKPCNAGLTVCKNSFDNGKHRTCNSRILYERVRVTFKHINIEEIYLAFQMRIIIKNIISIKKIRRIANALLSHKFVRYGAIDL